MSENSEKKQNQPTAEASRTADVRVTGFLDYRSWLDAVYSALKEQDPHYSYLRFSRDLRLGSSNAHLVLRGKRKLSKKTGGHVADALGLDKDERAYLDLLIQLDTSKTQTERDAAFDRIVRKRIELLASKVERDELAFFTQWHHAAILELLHLDGSKDQAEWIAKHLMPTVPLHEVKKSLELLVKLGYLGYRADLGRLYPVKTEVRASKSSARLAVLSMHAQMLDLAKAALTGLAPEDREISAATLRVSKETFKKFKKKLVAVREELVAEADATDGADEVVQLSLQMFPLTRRFKKE